MNKKEIKFILNDRLIAAEVNHSMPLLDFIRKEQNLKGTKEVCKEGDCGACTVLLGTFNSGIIQYKTITSCIYPIGNCEGKHIVTIEGINKKDLSLQQKAFVDEHAAQCGFCTPGFIMSLTCYLLNNQKYEIEKAINSIAGNICRCTGYHSIIRATQSIISELKGNTEKDPISFLIDKNVIPNYFDDIKTKLKKIEISNHTSTKSKTFVGGGSDLFVQKPDSMLIEEIDFVNKRNLNFITEADGKIEIGASTTFEEFKNSEIVKRHFPCLPSQLNLVASLPVRNAATIGGNICNASPIGDLSIILLALNAEVLLSDGEIEKVIPLNKFYIGYKKLNKANNEFIKSVSFTIPKGTFSFSFEKVSKRTYLDIASVNSALLIEYENNKIVHASVTSGGVAPIPFLLKETNNFLVDKIISIELIHDMLSVAQQEISPISDVRGSADYKRLLLNQLIKAHFLKLFPNKILEEELV